MRESSTAEPIDSSVTVLWASSLSVLTVAEEAGFEREGLMVSAADRGAVAHCAVDSGPVSIEPQPAAV